MTASPVALDWNGAIATIRMDDPASLNAMTAAMIDALLAALDVVAGKARVLIVTGAGRAFCSGASLTAGIGDIPGDSDDYDVGRGLETHLNPLMARLRDLPLPWISAVRGPAAGAGASLALAADLIVASETAYFVQAFAKIGLVPDAGAPHLLVRTIGRPRAMELMLLGDRLPAAQALEWGLINRLVPDDALEQTAQALAARLAEGPSALRLIRRMAWDAVDGDWASGLAAERTLQRTAGLTADHREGVAAFRDKRAPRFTGC